MKLNNCFSLLWSNWTSGICSLLLAGCLSETPDSGKKVFTYNESDGIATLDPAFAKNRSIIWAVHQLYSTLVETDDRLRIVPGLARSWEVSPDRRVWTFHLRTDVFFHDDPVFPGGKGRRLVAGDVVYSFHRILDPATASSGAWIFHGRIGSRTAEVGRAGVGRRHEDRVAPVVRREGRSRSDGGGASGPTGRDEAFEALDDSTFRLWLIRPFQPVLGLLSMAY